MNPCLDIRMAGVVSGERWIVHSNGHVGVAMRDAVTATTKNNDTSGLIRFAIAAAPIVVVPAPGLLEFVGPACEKCRDARRSKCRSCSGTSKIVRDCEHCGEGSHECACDSCTDGYRGCVCTRDERRPARLISDHFYDRRLVGIALRDLPQAAAYGLAEMQQQPSKKPNADGSVLIIHAGDQIGIVMEIRIERDDKSRYPRFNMGAVRS